MKHQTSKAGKHKHTHTRTPAAHTSTYEEFGGVLYSARRGLRTTEARENWEEREERKGTKATPEGSKFLTLSHPFVGDNNELCYKK